MKNISKTKRMLAIAVCCILLFSCGNPSGVIDETPTRGHIKITVDESYQLLIDAELQVFQSIYTYAKVDVAYKPEAEAIADLMNDSVRLVVVNRKLTDQEDQYLKNKQLIPRTTKIAYDGMAFIVNKKNTDTLIRWDQIRDIFAGRINNWKQLNPKSNSADLKVVFDNNKSGNVRQIKEQFKINQSFPEYCFAVKSNPEVIKYVEENQHAIGVIGVNWISDPHDTISHQFLNNINVVEIGNENNTDGSGLYCKPYQGYIAESSYPLRREVYIISRETFSGLGTGFASFVAGDKGQRIILKAGMVPATMPVRLIQVKK
ncbi:MAG: substrate-binding domain-containing protein [Bacteroidota bacterium]